LITLNAETATVTDDLLYACSWQALRENFIAGFHQEKNIFVLSQWQK